MGTVPASSAAPRHWRLWERLFFSRRWPWRSFWWFGSELLSFWSSVSNASHVGGAVELLIFGRLWFFVFWFGARAHVCALRRSFDLRDVRSVRLFFNLTERASRLHVTMCTIEF